MRIFSLIFPCLVLFCFSAHAADMSNSHPLEKKGLIRIQKDGSYIYKTSTGVKNRSASFRIGQIEAPGIESADGQTNFESMYGGSGVVAVQFDYEWQPFTGWGKVGVVAGGGLFTAQGSGRFLDGSEAQEQYTFIGLPLSLGGIYRLELSDRQWLAPYVSGGASYYILAETRDDSKTPSVTGTPAAYGAGGLLISISHWDRGTRHTLWTEYGIANMWLSLEYKVTQASSQDLDVSSNAFNVGLTFDF